MESLTTDEHAPGRAADQTDRRRWRAGAVLHHVAPWGGSGVLVVIDYLVVRWSPSPLAVLAVVDLLFLGILGALAYRGVRGQFAAPYVVTALVLPSMLTVVLALAGMQRLEAEITEMLRSVFPFFPMPD